MILHHIQTSPGQDRALDCALKYAAVEDSFMFSGNGVNALLIQKWKSRLNDKTVFLLKTDVQARGLEKLLAAYTQIEHNQFVEQTLIHKKVITW
ncbi:sulfurtransferase complex subunit TusB [Shewanella eurypsychrophilus]|uniref:Sulfurtransferase complex subunit TusB n=1 Tax=Shewanella eurypsychrophilus TaxID=2593656 RepID=A0ABX6V6A5_9GAMM|nr:MULTISPECIES: sulfurtransferase complex subunit TusB [Shewanella]QFU22765.1 sulfurtransferase complex subunit TusB [Shewanella sp. YLB-09]QPG58054.1 sulfurtransferase complex subunit TusB [Shewanella eurypsychrophilus]